MTCTHCEGTELKATNSYVICRECGQLFVHTLIWPMMFPKTYAVPDNLKEATLDLLSEELVKEE